MTGAEPRFTSRPELSGTFGMVASTHWLASAAGMATLEAGGNAFDAAVATGFALQVVEPHLNGPAGEVPILSYSEADDRVEVICGQGPSPAAATVERFEALGLDLVPGTGLLACCVPGAFDAWMLLLRDHGTLGVRDVLRFAIGYAEEGFPALGRIVDAIAGVEELFGTEWPTSGALWLPVPAVGTRMTNPVLAGTYRRLADEAEAAGGTREAQIDAARAAWSEGFVAEAIVGFLADAEALDSSGRRHRGLLSGDDLAGYRATVEAPVSRAWDGWTVFKTGPWGQGPVLLQHLALLEGFDLAAMTPVERVHTVLECAKLALADRDAWYGDSAPVPLDDLLSAAYAGERRALVDPASASGELRPGAPGGRSPRMPAPLRVEGEAGTSGVGVGEPTLLAPAERTGDTCHIDVADRHGNLVSATPSGGWLQSSPAIPGLGFALGSRAQMFWLGPEGLPSRLAPRRRPRTTLTPSLAVHEDGARLAWGTPGGDQQDQWSLLLFLNHVVDGMNLQEAIDAPAYQTAHFPSSFYPRAFRPRSVQVEDRLGDDVIAGLRERGHEVELPGPWSLGRLSAVRREPDGTLRAGANPRGMQGYAVGR